ncbi:MAG: hypothetical protein OCU22_09280 [Canidatus Methanoxibalbensis ujae]|nr:hypothetical protein [Candidatus Methanoxibalbensis ujae]
MVNVERAAKKRRDRVAVASEDYKEGVETTDKDWLARFKEAKDRRNAQLRRAMDLGWFERGAERVGTEGWRDATLAKADRWAAGAASDLADERYKTAMAEVADCIERARKAIASMPSNTIEQRADRARKFAIEMNKCIEEKKSAGKL